jgi:hypothetical protein
MTTTMKAAIERFDRLQSYGGVVRGKWQSTDDQGREIACWLGALDADINNPHQCSADLMPQWLAHMIPDFDDNTSAGAWFTLMERFRVILPKLQHISSEGFERARLKTNLASLNIASPYDKHNVVQLVIDLTIRALSGDQPTEKEWAADAADAARAAYAASAASAASAAGAAYAARAAADAADAAYAAASAASAAASAASAAGAAYAAAYAASAASAASAAGAAADAASAASAASAAGAAADAAYAAARAAADAAWDQICTACFDALELEASHEQCMTMTQHTCT